MSKRKELSLQEKYNVIKKFDSLPKCSQRDAANLLGIAQPSLSRLLKRRNEVATAIANSGNLRRKRKRGGKAIHIEQALLEWYTNVKFMNVPLTRAFLLQKAEDIANELGDTSFVATDGWLSRWRDRYNVVLNKDHNRGKVDAPTSKLYENDSLDSKNITCSSLLDEHPMPESSVETILAPLDSSISKSQNYPLKYEEIDENEKLLTAEEVYNALGVIGEFFKQKGVLIENYETFYKVKDLIDQLLHR